MVWGRMAGVSLLNWFKSWPIFKLVLIHCIRSRFFELNDLTMVMFLWWSLWSSAIFNVLGPKGFSASKCDLGNWIFSKLGIFEKFFGHSLDFLGIYFWIFFLRNFFWGFFGRIFFWEEFFVYIVKVS